MFIQVIQGRVSDADALERAMDRWLVELKPGATGWLGSMSGVTADGEAILLARFESADAAAANSQRPEQGAWWSEAEKAFDGEVTFHDSDDVVTSFGGGSDDAGFVQIIQGSATNREALDQIEADAEDLLREVHTGLIGGLRCWYGDNEYTEAIYFTDEATARAGEQAMGEHPDAQKLIVEFQSLIGNARYLDLTSPSLHSA